MQALIGEKVKLFSEAFYYMFFNYVVVRYSEVIYSLPQWLCAYYYYSLDGKWLGKKKAKFLYCVVV